MKGVLYKKQNFGRRMGEKVLATLKKDNYGEKGWPLRQVELEKDGTLTVSEFSSVNGEPTSGTYSSKFCAQCIIFSQIAKGKGIEEKGKLLGALNLREGEVSLRVSLPRQHLYSELAGRIAKGARSIAPTPFHFQITLDRSTLLKPQNWESWNFCARNKEECIEWLNTLTDITYASRSDDGPIDENRGRYYSKE